MTKKVRAIRQQFGKQIHLVPGHCAQTWEKGGGSRDCHAKATSAAAARFMRSGLGAALEVGSAQGRRVAAQKRSGGSPPNDRSKGMTLEYSLHHYHSAAAGVVSSGAQGRSAVRREETGSSDQAASDVGAADRHAGSRCHDPAPDPKGAAAPVNG